ncbi:MAG: NADH-ubiquinone oxidoreductase-F iron-sulfur binding region domain-containing protein [Dermatophilaceae bacterium]
MTRVYVPSDAAALSMGADDVAEAFAALPDAEVVRTGSRGMLWAEPLVELDSPAGRVGFAAVSGTDAAAIIALGASHPAYLGIVADHPWLGRQQRVTTTRLGVVDPSSATDYERHGGWAGLRTALALEPGEVIDAVMESGLRGRGGAGFPTAVKWRTVAGAPDALKFVCANADEGDSGTFADRMLMEGDPFSTIEGMLIAAYAVGATEGFVYIRSEYPQAIRAMTRAAQVAREAGFLGRGILGSGLDFDLEIRVGAGAYICGEETSMLNSIEGRRGEVRSKPPIPALSGLFGLPTVVNNLLTLTTVPGILADGPAAYAALGTDRSRGTQVFQLAGNVACGGLIETGFGVTLRDLVENYGGGTRSGRPVRAVQVGGPLGAYVPASQLDIPLDYESMAAAGFMLGHGGIVVFDDTVDMARQARFAMEFCATESCGKCTPCRLGSQRGVETIEHVMAGRDVASNLVLLQDLCTTMTKGSLCAMGGLTPLPVRSALTHFPEDFTATAAAARRGTP